MKQFLEKFFELKFHKTSISTEFFAALTTFLSMSYVIFVNPSILSEAGIPKEALITVTILITAFGTLLIGLFGKIPVATAPGMGLNAVFTFILVKGYHVTWQVGLGVVFISALFFFILTLFNFQKKIVDHFPPSLKVGITSGIGLFLTFLGLRNLGLIGDNPATLVQMNPLSPTILIGLVGLFLTIVLMIYRVKAAIVIGIVVSTSLSMIFGCSDLPSGVFSMPHPIASTFLQLDIKKAFNIALLSPLFTFMFVDLFDSVSTVASVMEKLEFKTPQMKDKQLNRTLKTDSFLSMVGALFGSSTTVIYMESMTGISEGGKTGLTSIFIALLFLLTLFFSPLIAIVPAYATAPALIIVGILMAQDLKHIDLSKLKESFPAFLTAVLIPFTYNISTGLSFGFISYVFLEIMTKNIKNINWIIWVITVLCVINLILH